MIKIEIFETISSILSNLGIFFTTVFGFWLYHCSKNVKITSFGKSYSQFFGHSMNCTIYNKTMSPKTVCEIDVVFDNKYVMSLKRFEEPILLEPFHAYNIIGDKYSQPIDIPSYTDVYFKLSTPEKTLLVPFHGKIRGKSSLEPIETRTHRFNNVVLSSDVRYVLTYWYKETKDKHNIYITKNGFMDKNIKNFNILPNDIINSPNQILDFFKNQFNDPNWCCVINEIKW